MEEYQLDNHKVFQAEEEWSKQEKLSYISKLFAVSLVLVLLSIGMIYLTFTIYTLLSNFVIFMFACSSVLLFMFSIAAAIWSRQQNEQLKKQEQDYVETSNSLFSRLILTFSSLLSIVIINFFFYLMITEYQINGTQSAMSTPSNDAQITKDTQSHILSETYVFILYARILLGLSLIAIFCLLYTIFVSFAFTNSVNAIRLFIYFFGLYSLIIIVFWVLQIRILERVPLNDDQSLDWILIPLVICSSIGALLVYIFNFAKYKIGYLCIGTFLIALIIVELLVSGFYLRKTIDQQFTSDQIALRTLSASEIQHYGCKIKYYGDSLDDCAPEAQVIPWEKDLGTNPTCLNTNCNTLAKQFLQNKTLYMVFLMTNLVGSQFVLFCACFFLSNRFPGDKTLNPMVERALIFLFICFVCLGIYWYTVPVFRENFNPSLSESFQVMAFKVSDPTKMDTYLPPKFANCQKLTKLLNSDFSLSLNKTLCDTMECTDQGFIAGVSVDEGNLKIHPKAQNLEDIWVYDSSVSEQCFDHSDESSSVVFSGLPDQVGSFFKNVLYCNEGQASTFNVTLLQSNLTKQISAKAALDEKKKKRILSGKKHLQAPASASASTSASTPQVNSTAGNGWLDSNMKFYNTQINVVDYSNGQSLPDASVMLYEGVRQCMQQDKTDPSTTINTATDGTVQLYNLVNGYGYTLLIQKDGFQSNCAYIQEQTKSLSVGLAPKLMTKLTMELILTWQGTATLNLLGIANLNADQNCYMGGQNVGCPGVTFSQYLGNNIQTLTINQFGEMDYMFYVQEQINTTLKQQYLAKQTNDKIPFNSQFLNSNASLQVYVNELDFPAFTMDMPMVYSGKMAFPEQENIQGDTKVAFPLEEPAQTIRPLFWMLGCVDGSSSDVVKIINQFWLNSDDSDPKMPKIMSNSYSPSLQLCDFFQQ